MILKLKITLVGLTYPGQHPQSPSLSRGLITGGLISGDSYPVAYIQGLISGGLYRGLYPGGLYPGAYVWGT